MSGVAIVSSAEFRQIAVPGDGGRPEKLFRAAISAFTSLTRPSRRDAAQLDDLTAPLYGSLSPEAKRFAAAALSDVTPAPPNLVRRLADEPVEIAAPLLVRSPVLEPIHLLALIGRHGLAHARAIAGRRMLDPAIADLVAALEKAARREASADRPEAVREKLRAMMRHDPATEPLDAEARYARLRDAALTGEPGLFHTVLADIFDLALAAARRLTAPPGYTALLPVLRALDLAPERAFLVAAAVLPAAFGSARAMRLFLERYEALDGDDARARMRALGRPDTILKAS